MPSCIDLTRNLCFAPEVVVMTTRSPGFKTPPSPKCWDRSLGAFAMGCSVVQPPNMQAIRQNTMNAFIGLSQNCARVARLPGHIILFKPHSLGVKSALHEFSRASE